MNIKQFIQFILAYIKYRSYGYYTTYFQWQMYNPYERTELEKIRITYEDEILERYDYP